MYMEGHLYLRHKNENGKWVFTKVESFVKLDKVETEAWVVCVIRYHTVAMLKSGEQSWVSWYAPTAPVGGLRMSKLIYWKCIHCNSMINDENMHDFSESVDLHPTLVAEFCYGCHSYNPEVVLAYAWCTRPSSKKVRAVYSAKPYDEGWRGGYPRCPYPDHTRWGLMARSPFRKWYECNRCKNRLHVIRPKPYDCRCGGRWRVYRGS